MVLDDKFICLMCLIEFYEKSTRVKTCDILMKFDDFHELSKQNINGLNPVTFICFWGTNSCVFKMFFKVLRKSTWCQEFDYFYECWWFLRNTNATQQWIQSGTPFLVLDDKFRCWICLLNFYEKSTKVKNCRFLISLMISLKYQSNTSMDKSCNVFLFWETHSYVWCVW